MEYTNPFSCETQGFVSLLSSQSIELDSSELPAFSSQCSDESSAKERRKWSPKEDVILIGAWLNTSKDPVISNEQKAGAFWRRIMEYYNSNPQLVGTPPRELGQCKQRWSRLNDQVCKWVGCYDAASREQSSGQNENDVMKAAHELYLNDYKIKFSLDHAWRELRHDQKWCSTCLSKDGGKDKRKTVVDLAGQEETPEERPAGVKAAKAAAKRKKTGKEEAMTQLQSMLEVKKEISKQKLLDRLLAKAEPLSELEVSLKLKLIGEML